MFRSNATQLLLDKSAREGRKITQKEVAQATNLTESTLVAWFSDEPMLQVRSKAVSALCQYFDCTISELLTAEGVRKTPNEATKSPKLQTPLLSAG